jgi:hypothetical protein
MPVQIYSNKLIAAEATRSEFRFWAWTSGQLPQNTAIAVDPRRVTQVTPLHSERLYPDASLATKARHSMSQPVMDVPRSYLTAGDDPVLAALWDNEYDAIYDNL